MVYTFIDNHTRMCWVYLLKDKLSQVFIDFHTMTRNNFQAKNQVLRTDNDSEFFHFVLSSFLTNHGTIH